MSERCVMSQKLPPAETVISRLFELYGGKEPFFRKMDDRFAEIDRRWNQNTDSLGRILRAHLFVEHFISAYISSKNPNLAKLEKARLSFAQKVELLDHKGSPEAYLVPGLRRLNLIRNRIAHTLDATVTLSDQKCFLSIKLFSAMRRARAERSELAETPISVLEDFAKHAGSSLEAASHPESDFWQAAFKVTSGA